MIQTIKGRTTAQLMLIQALLALVTALAALLRPGFYLAAVNNRAWAESLLPGTLAQDLITVPAAIILAVLSAQFLSWQRYKSFIIMLGLSAYLFYTYGQLVISGSYTVLYPLYLLIFALAIYSLILGLNSFSPPAVKQIRLPDGIRRTVAGFLLLMVLVFAPQCLFGLVSGAVQQVTPDNFAILVLDLAIIMPAFGITAVMLLRHNPFGNILAGVALMKGLTLLLFMAVKTAVAPVYGLPLNHPMLGIYCLTVLFAFVLGTFYMLNLLRRF